MAKKYRDGLFRDYFSDKRRLLALCNLLAGEDATDPNEIKINTLDGVFFDSFKNDISCLFRGKILVIIEHQSTVNENMPLRMLFYAAELLKQHVDEHKKKIYLENPVSLPAPQFFVFYNGTKKELARREMRLSDAFEISTSLELVVQLYNINAGMNEDFILQAKELNHYCIFVNKVKNFLVEGVDFAHAIAATFDYCMAHDIMKEYLLTRKKELASMLALEYDADLARQAWIEFGEERGIEQGIERGIEQGIEQGRSQEKISIVGNLLRAKTPLEYIVAATGWSKEQILSLAKN